MSVVVPLSIQPCLIVPDVVAPLIMTSCSAFIASTMPENGTEPMTVCTFAKARRIKLVARREWVRICFITKQAYISRHEKSDN